MLVHNGGCAVACLRLAGSVDLGWAAMSDCSPTYKTEENEEEESEVGLVQQTIPTEDERGQALSLNDN